jgi:DNA-binding transcriptional LysR family regulator
MRSGDIEWSLWRSFLGILRQGSLSGAARTLAVAQPTVRRHLETLEASLGTTLFARSPTGLVPTEIALDLRASAEAMEAAAAFLVRTASGDSAALAGTVRITASEIVGAEILPRILAQLRERHPALSFDVTLSNRTEDVMRHDADLAIRMVRPAQGQLVARKAGDLTVGLFAHQTWLEGRPKPTDLKALAETKCLIGYDTDRAIIRALEAHGISLSRSAFCFRSDSDLAQLAAIRAGIGVGPCQVGLAACDPALRRVLPHLEFNMEVWIAVHPDLRENRRVRVTFDDLVAGLQGYMNEADARKVSTP